MNNQENTKVIHSDEIPNFMQPNNFELQLLYQGTQYSITSVDKLPVYIGRNDSQNHICVADEVVSRQHCSIEFTNGRLELRDSSTNGTYLSIGNSEPFSIKGQSSPLMGKGTIQLGDKVNSADDSRTIYYRIVY